MRFERFEQLGPGVKLHIVCEMWLFNLFFFQFCKSDMSRYGYLELFQRVPWTEITRVDCICTREILLKYDLPQPWDLLKSPPTKFARKRQVRKQVDDYWTKNIRSSVALYPSLGCLHADIMYQELDIQSFGSQRGEGRLIYLYQDQSCDRHVLVYPLIRTTSVPHVCCVREATRQLSTFCPGVQH